MNFLKLSMKGAVLSAVIAAGILAASTPAAANSIVPDFTGTVDNGGGDISWFYDVYISSGRISPVGGIDEDFTIYDFNGYTGTTGVTGTGSVYATFAPAGFGLTGADWNLHINNTTAPGGPLGDNPGQPNLEFHYVGAATVNRPSGASLLIGTMEIHSTLGDAFGRLVSTSSHDSTPRFGAGTGSTGGTFATQVNTNTTFAPAPAPEPGSLLLIGSGLLGLAGVRRLRLRK